MKNRNRSLFATEYSERALERLKILEKYDTLIKETCTKDVALQVLEISRATLTRWKQRLREEGIVGLEDFSRRPQTIRKSLWTEEEKLRVYNLRNMYPFLGKEKIAVMYKNDYQIAISASKVGRILKSLLREHKIKSVADVCGKKYKKPRNFTGHAQRLPKGMKAVRVGQLVQVDHMSVDIPNLKPGKHFNAICSVSKYAISKTYWQATSYNAKQFLKLLIKSLPFKLESIQVDGGSEFMGDFETACAELQIPLYVLPPLSPKLNGCVERVNGTFRDEFYALHSSFKSIDDFVVKLDQFTQFYNIRRPHHRLRLLTPCQFLEKI